MTCVVGVVKDGAVFMGADSSGISGNYLELRADPKVFVTGEMVVGFTSSFRMGQLLQYEMEVPTRDPECSLERYMVTQFVPAVRKCLERGGVLRHENSVESGGQFLVGTEGRLFMIDSDFQVGETLSGFSAIGSGFQAALGALNILVKMPDWDPARSVLAALDSAETFCSEVRHPFILRETPAGFDVAKAHAVLRFSGSIRVATMPPPEGQKFPPGARVRIADDLGPAMRHFPGAGKMATVRYTYAHFCGGDSERDLKQYCLDVDGEGEHSWYDEDQLTLVL